MERADSALLKALALHTVYRMVLHTITIVSTLSQSARYLSRRRVEAPRLACESGSGLHGQVRMGREGGGGEREAMAVSPRNVPFNPIRSSC